LATTFTNKYYFGCVEANITGSGDSWSCDCSTNVQETAAVKATVKLLIDHEDPVNAGKPQQSSTSTLSTAHGAASSFTTTIAVAHNWTQTLNKQWYLFNDMAAQNEHYERLPLDKCIILKGLNQSTRVLQQSTPNAAQIAARQAIPREWEFDGNPKAGHCFWQFPDEY